MTGSKLGIHVCNWSYEAEKHAECRPAVFKSIEHNAEKLAKFKATSPGTLTVGRVVMDGWDGRADFQNPKFDAETVAGIILANIKGCRYDVLEGTNEPIINNDEDALRLAEFNYELSKLLKIQGFQFAAYSFGGTRPDIKYWPMLMAGLYNADYLAMHAYGPGPLFHEPYWYLFNYRLSWEALSDEIKKSLKGLLLTEYGIAKGLLHTQKDVGWMADGGPPITAREYEGDLIESDKQLDCYVKGATIYQTGGLYGKWRTFEFKQLLPGIEGHIRSFVRPNDLSCMGKNPSPKIKVAVRLSWRIAFSPIIGHKELPLEEYLPDVLPREMGKDFNAPLEALKAQAIAARTYALRAMKYPRHGSDHICNSACCQVWAEGARYPLSDQAVRETAGIDIRYKGEPIEAFYSANCGGKTINSEDRGWKPLPYCRSVPCPVGGTVSGHKVGLCQYGAREMARQGKNAEQILKHYYTGVTVNLPVPSPPPVVPPEPPAPPPSPPERTLQVISRRQGPPVIVGDLEEAGKQIRLVFWNNEAKTTSGDKPEYGVGGFEVNYWRAADSTFDLFVDGKKYPIEVKKSAPFTGVGWSSEQEKPSPPPPPPVPPEPHPDVGLRVYDADGNERDMAWVKSKYNLPDITQAPRNKDHWEVVELRENDRDSSVTVKVLSVVGEPLFGQPVIQTWPGGEFKQSTDRQGKTAFGMGRGSYYRPAKDQVGPHSVYMLNGASDTVTGLGMLGGTDHHHLEPTFQFVKAKEA